jgi:hypothetical protein
VVDGHSAVHGREGPETALGLLELPLEADTVPAAGLVPRDDDVDEPLEEVLEGLVGGEVLAFPREVEPELQISRDRS